MKESEQEGRWSKLGTRLPGILLVLVGLGITVLSAKVGVETALDHSLMFPSFSEAERILALGEGAAGIAITGAGVMLFQDLPKK